jgi:spermidine synthase
MPQKQPVGAGQRIELLATAFTTGAAVMVVEILGTRVIGPVFGASLFVWSALLAVTLAALALGYYGGGIAIDRWPLGSVLGGAILAAGVALGLTPVISGLVLRACDQFGPRIGPLVSALVLFGPTLSLLGTVGPMVIRLANSEVQATGHRVGSVYAISTVGSLFGTFVTSFALVPAFETRQILTGTAVLLGIVGAAICARRGRPAAAVAALLPAIGLWHWSPALPEGIEMVDEARSPYGLVQVIDLKDRGVRLMRADHSIIGARAPDGSAAFAFLHMLEALPYMRPAAKDMLQIGLGIGSLPMALARFGVKTDVVEIDPDVVRFAVQHFAFRTEGETFVEDARTHLQRTPRKYDLVVHDTFTGGTTPEHLLSVEVLERIRAILRPSGVLALNFVGYSEGPHAEAAWAVARTVRAVFPNVRVFRDHPPAERSGTAGNLMFFASASSLDFQIPTDARFENEVCERTLRSFTSWEVLQQVPVGPTITDQRNPLARLQLPIAEEHFSAMKKLLPLEVWIR